MELFFKLEIGYIGIALFVLLITLIVTTRPFIAKGVWKKALAVIAIMMSIFIGAHYMVTTSRISGVENTFNSGGKVVCESRAIRKVAQSVTIEKSNNWSLNNHMFSSPNYERDFFTARCIKHVPVTLDIPKN